MPHERCTACKHPEAKAVDAALLAGESVRAVARRFGLSSGAVDRHQRNHLRGKGRVNPGDLARIDREINKLIRAQNRAKRQRDNLAILAIARELRNWFILRQKAEVVSNATSQVETFTTMTRSEALAVAEGLIESEVNAGGQEVIAWLHALVERVRPPGNLPEAQE